MQAGLSVDGIEWAFTTPIAGIWHPVTLLSHMLDVELFGLEPAGHHWTSVLLHVVNALLLLELLARATGSRWRSAAVAALFALHPLQVESVAWIAERKNVLCTFFWLLSCLAYLGYVRRPGAARYALVAALFALALMAKPMAVTLPFALLLLDAWPLGRLGRTAVVEKLPLLVLSAAASAAVLATQVAGGAMTPLETLGLGQRIANAVAAYGLYLLRTVWPADLSVLYPHLGPLLPGWWVAVSGVVLGALTFVALRAARSRPGAAVGWLWFLGTLVPVIGLVQVGAQSSADRYTYLPLIGLGMAGAWGIPEPTASDRGRRAVLAVAAGLALAALAVVSSATLRHWRDSLTLFQQALRATRDSWLPYPPSPIIHRNLAAAYADAGRDVEAVAHYRRVVELGNARPAVHLYLGNALMRLERFEEAADEFERALAGEPENDVARLHLGLALAGAGRFAEAAAELADYVAAHPDEAEARVRLADALARTGRRAEAIRVVEAGVAARPDDPVMANNLAWLLATSADPSLRDGGRAVRIAEGLRDVERPTPSGLDTLAAAYAAAGRFSDAVRTGRAAAELAEQRGHARLAAELRERLARYEAGRAWIEAPPGP